VIFHCDVYYNSDFSDLMKFNNTEQLHLVNVHFWKSIHYKPGYIWQELFSLWDLNYEINMLCSFFFFSKWSEIVWPWKWKTCQKKTKTSTPCVVFTCWMSSKISKLCKEFDKEFKFSFVLNNMWYFENIIFLMMDFVKDELD